MPGNVFAQDVIDYQGKVLAAEQRTLDQKWRRRAGLLMALAVTLLVSNLMQAGALRYLIPLKELLPIVLFKNENNDVIRAAVTPEALDVNMRDATIQSVLFQYTMWRQSYNSQTVGLAHSIVDAMSETKVAADYDAWIGAHSNPKSYQNIYGDKCSVQIVQDQSNALAGEWTPPGPNGTLPGRYTFRFWQIITCRDEKPQPATEWLETIDFLAGYRGGLNFWITKMFNAPRIVVTGYAPPRPLQALPKDMAR